MLLRFRSRQYGVLTALFFFIACLLSCDSGDRAVSPKPRMYPRIEFPPHEYNYLQKTDCGFSFRKSAHTMIAPRTRFFGQDLPSDCWFDLIYPDLNTTIHFTYYPIDEEHDYGSLVNESFKMAYEHSSIASAIGEEKVMIDGKEAGMVFSLRGQVASPYQFFLTDTTDHFLRGSLYFNAHPNADSTAPVLDYLLVDIDTLIQSIKWN